MISPNPMGGSTLESVYMYSASLIAKSKQRNMVAPISVLKKTATAWLNAFYRAEIRRIRNLFLFFFLHTNPSRMTTNQENQLQPLSLINSRHLQGRKDYTLLLNFNNSLLRTNSLFPFFMLVAFEGSGLIRATLLLLAWPVVLLLGQSSDLALRVMVFVAFCGLKCGDMDVVARAVLPKIYAEEMDCRSYEVAAAAGRRVVVSCLPKIMVERFVFDCFGWERTEVLGPELEVGRGKRRFTGKFAVRDTETRRFAAVKERFQGETADVGLVRVSNVNDQLLIIPCSKDVYAITKKKARSSRATTDSPTKPVIIFHDGRLAFLPTPSAFLCLLMYLPLGSLLCLLRILVGLVFPYSLSNTLEAALGMRFRVVLPPCGRLPPPAVGVIYACTHRTLLDPVLLSHSLSRPVPAVTYSLSRLSEALSPIPTVRLSRDRRRDSLTMHRLLSSGDLAVCPEGTTCREPFLLRFSPLFAEMTDEIEPVAMSADCSMFYATTATGKKFLDPAFFFLNPTPAYQVNFLGRLPKEATVAGGYSAVDVANRVQRDLAQELGFRCTALTRRDKYLSLAGNHGLLPEALQDE